MKTSKSIGFIVTGLAIASASVMSVAQTPTSTTTPTTQSPTAVGVTPQTAANANKNAVPRSDTATVVRTGPDAVDAARSAASSARSTMDSASQGATTGAANKMRPAKADRN